jgi:hypothetical protein
MDIGKLDRSNGDRPTEELSRLGDRIAELASHLDAATARLLDLIREFDARAAGTPGSATVPPG